MSKVIVTFEKNWRGYAAGETAGFDTAVAESLIESGYAVETSLEAEQGGKPSASPAAKSTKPATKKPASTKAAAPAKSSTDATGGGSGAQPEGSSDTEEKP